MDWLVGVRGRGGLVVGIWGVGAGGWIVVWCGVVWSSLVGFGMLPIVALEL